MKAKLQTPLYIQKSAPLLFLIGLTTTTILGSGPSHAISIPSFESSVATYCQNHPGEMLSTKSQVGRLAYYMRTNGDAVLKPKNELSKYMSCYPKNNDIKYQEQYSNEYKSYIEAAAFTFDVPEQLLTCLLFRESKWDKNAVSKTGAIGLCQFVTDAIDFVNDNLKDDRSKKEIASDHSIIASGIPTKGQVKYIDKRRVNLKDYLYVKALIPKEERIYLWDNYFGMLEYNENHKDVYRLHYPNETRPTQFSKVGAKRPPNCIGAAAFKLHYMFDFFSNQLSPEENIRLLAAEEDSLVDYLTAVAGAYNIGHGAARRALNNVSKPITSKKWVEQIGKLKVETKHHMEAIRTCMKMGTLDPPPGDKGECQITD